MKGLIIGAALTTRRVSVFDKKIVKDDTPVPDDAVANCFGDVKNLTPEPSLRVREFLRMFET
jgi:hypothetical protein